MGKSGALGNSAVIHAIYGMQKWAGKVGREKKSKSLMMVQIIHLVKLESDVNYQHVIEVNSRGNVELMNTSKRKRCKGVTTNHTSLFREAPLKCLLVMF